MIYKTKSLIKQLIKKLFKFNLKKEKLLLLIKILKIKLQVNFWNNYQNHKKKTQKQQVIFLMNMYNLKKINHQI